MSVASAVFKPMHKEGYRFVGIFAAITVVLFLLGGLWSFFSFLGWIGVVLTIWCYYFFRDPVRYVPTAPGLLVSPADGVISHIQPSVPPVELGLGASPLTRVSVFMNVFNCHVNRAPIAGTIEKVAYTSGKFLNASLDKASEDNERNGVVIRVDDDNSIGVVQIAGLVARRILCEVSEGQSLRTGQRFGLIRFGSRVDVYLPRGVEPIVGIGQTTIAGETVIADMEGSGTARSFMGI